MNFDGRDKRIAARYTTRVFGIFGRDIDLDETEMLMMNMSLGGAFVRTDTPVPPGQPVMLRIYLDESSQPISIAGEVVWWRAPGQGKEPGMGVKFTQMSAAESARFKGFLAELIEEDLFR
jgi:uncharacterized protein (TIGR02266 family)